MRTKELFLLILCLSVVYLITIYKRTLKTSQVKLDDLQTSFNEPKITTSFTDTSYEPVAESKYGLGEHDHILNAVVQLDSTSLSKESIQSSKAFKNLEELGVSGNSTTPGTLNRNANPGHYSQSNSTVVQVDDAFMERMKLRMEARRNHVKTFCQEHNIVDFAEKIRNDAFYFKNFDVFFCHVPKTGSKNWNKMLLEYDATFQGGGLNISEERFNFKKLLPKYKLRDNFGIISNNRTIKLMVVREPMERIVSAFREKLGDDPKPYLRYFSRKVHKTFGDFNSEAPGYANFSEFVQYFVKTTAPYSGDIHWQRYRRLCQPCAIDYDVIGHKETMEEDSRYFMKLIGAPDRISLGGAEPYATKTDVVRQYYAAVRPRENVNRLYNKLRVDYMLYNYSQPEIIT